MCEDRSSPLKKGVRFNRIQHARLRNNRIARRIRPPTPPTQNNEPSVPSMNETIQVTNIPVPIEAAASSTTNNFQQIPRLNMSNKHDDDEPWSKLQPQYQIRRDNLIEIAMRTVMLMRQNQQLQQKLAALQAETKMFMQAVMNNPENKTSAQNETTPKEEMDDEDEEEKPKSEIEEEKNEESHEFKLEKE